MFIGRTAGRAPDGALLAAVGTGLAIAAYTVVDGIAVHKMPVTTYMGWVFMIRASSCRSSRCAGAVQCLPGSPRSAVLTGLG